MSSWKIHYYVFNMRMRILSIRFTTFLILILIFLSYVLFKRIVGNLLRWEVICSFILVFLFKSKHKFLFFVRIFFVLLSDFYAKPRITHYFAEIIHWSFCLLV